MQIEFGTKEGFGAQAIEENKGETHGEPQPVGSNAGGKVTPERPQSMGGISAVAQQFIPRPTPGESKTDADNSDAAVATMAPSPSVFKLGDRLPSFKDVILPRLNIVYAVGELGKSFPAGAIVFNKEIVLYTPPIIDAQQGVITQAATPPVVLYVIGIVSERFSEKIQGGMGGEIVDSETEVRAVGGTIDYREWNLKKGEGMRRFEPLIDLLIAIEKPTHICDPDGATFGFPVGDTQVAIGFWGCKGVSYTHAVKRVFNMHRLTGVLRGGYYTHSFKVSTRPEKFTIPNQGTFFAPVPVCVPKAKTTPEMLELIRSIVGA